MSCNWFFVWMVRMRDDDLSISSLASIIRMILCPVVIISVMSWVRSYSIMFLGSRSWIPLDIIA